MKRYSTTITTLLLITLIALLGLESTGATQTKRRQRTKPKPTPTPTPVVDMRAEATMVADQLKNTARFLYIYGKIADGLEITEKDINNPKTNAAVKAKLTAKNTDIKNSLVSNINDLKIGLDAIARKFQANPKLTVQYLKLSIAIEAVTNAQQYASAGRFDDSGKALIAVVEKLTDTIMSMRMP